MSEGEIDAHERIPFDYANLKLREHPPFIVNTIKFSQAESQHGFRILKLDQESKDQVLFILSTYEVLDSFGQLLTYPTQEFEQKVKSKELVHIDVTLQKLISFIKNCSMEDIEAEVLPNKKLQIISMDLKICVKLFAIVSDIGQKILE